MAEILDLEVLNDTLSFEIEKYSGKKFWEYDYVRCAHGPSLKDLTDNKLASRFIGFLFDG